MSPVEVHDRMHATTLAALLTRPGRPALRAASGDDLDPPVLQQAQLPPALGGVGLACSDAVCESAFLAGILQCLRYITEHRALLHTAAADSYLDSYLELSR